jgi:DNA polymerase delta subunit 1
MVQSYEQAAKMGLNKEDINETPNGYLFCNKSPGILPTILGTLLKQRKAAKKRMKEAPNDFERAVHNGYQLALKVGCNSLYGYCGATTSAVPAPNIASAVTAYGRQMIDNTSDWARREYPGTKIVYGDTDSIFALFPPVPGETPLEARQRAWAMAGDMENRINRDGTFKSPNFLEREKQFQPFYLLSKKRYAGMKYEGDPNKGKQDFTGLEIVRRDNCKLLKHTQEQFFNELLQNIDPQGAAKGLLKNITDLMTGKVPLELLTISKKLAKAKYAGNQIHASLNDRIRERTPALAYSVGERIPYVVIAGQGQLYDRGEDPTFVKENCLAIDRQYYFTKQIVGPMTRLLVPLFGKRNTELFFERGQQGAIHTHFKSNRQDWIPPLRGEDEVDEPKTKKRKPPPQKNSLTDYFKKSKP